MRLIEKVSGFRSAAINALIDAVAALRLVPGPGLLVRETPAGTVIYLDARPAVLRGWPYGSQYAFGLSIAAAAVTVHPGAVRAGGHAFLASEATVTITASGQYIGIALDRSAGTAAITGPHASRPVSSGDTWADALYCFTLADGVATLSRECIHDIRLEAGL